MKKNKFKPKKKKSESHAGSYSTTPLPEEVRRFKKNLETLVEFQKACVSKMKPPDYLVKTLEEVNRLSSILVGWSSLHKAFRQVQEKLAIPGQEMRAVNRLFQGYQKAYKDLARLERLNIGPALEIIEDHNEALRLAGKAWKDYFKINQQLAKSIGAKLKIYNKIGKEIKWIEDAQRCIFEINKGVFQSRLGEITKEYPPKIGLQVQKEIKIDKQEIETYLLNIKDGIERHGIYVFWQSRLRGELRKDPEDIAQALVSTNMYSMFPPERVVFDEQPRIGTGKIDIVVTFFNGRSLERIVLELKVFTEKSDFHEGIKQTFRYLELQRVNFGIRFIFNASNTELENRIHKDDGKVLKDIVVDINPINPSDL